jgi:hypothetical protein
VGGGVSERRDVVSSRERVALSGGRPDGTDGQRREAHGGGETISFGWVVREMRKGGEGVN